MERYVVLYKTTRLYSIVQLHGFSTELSTLFYILHRNTQLSSKNQIVARSQTNVFLAV